LGGDSLRLSIASQPRSLRSPRSVIGTDRVKLNSIDEGVIIDRPRVRGALAQRLAVRLARSSDVPLVDRRERDKLDGVHLDLPGPTRYRPPCLTRGRCHSRTERVVSPARTSLRNSWLNSTSQTLAGDPIPHAARVGASAKSESLDPGHSRQ
jgi:hypothetical protein